jgi:phosphoglycolate phosphatase-like HAD superfamily hydrolase
VIWAILFDLDRTLSDPKVGITGAKRHGSTAELMAHGADYLAHKPEEIISLVEAIAQFALALDLKKGRVILARVESLSNDLTQIL